MSEEKLTQKSTREPQALSSEYHKARKQLMLWAGTLFIWELVGIDLEKAKEVGGNAGAIISAIKSPQAVPWVLLVLVAYFLFKLWVEWNQCGSRRRETRHSRIDYGSAWVVAFVAYSLYAYQAMSRIQLADLLINSSRARSVVIGVPLGFVAFVDGIAAISHFRGRIRLNLRRSVSIVGETTVVLFIFIANFRRLNLSFTVLGILIGAGMPFLVRFMVKAFRRRKLANQFY